MSLDDSAAAHRIRPWSGPALPAVPTVVGTVGLDAVSILVRGTHDRVLYDAADGKYYKTLTTDIYTITYDPAWDETTTIYVSPPPADPRPGQTWSDEMTEDDWFAFVERAVAAADADAAAAPWGTELGAADAVYYVDPDDPDAPDRYDAYEAARRAALATRVTNAQTALDAAQAADAANRDLLATALTDLAAARASVAATRLDYVAAADALATAYRASGVLRSRSPRDEVALAAALTRIDAATTALETPAAAFTAALADAADAENRRNFATAALSDREADVRAAQQFLDVMTYKQTVEGAWDTLQYSSYTSGIPGPHHAVPVVEGFSGPGSRLAEFTRLLASVVVRCRFYARLPAPHRTGDGPYRFFAGVLDATRVDGLTAGTHTAIEDTATGEVGSCFVVGPTTQAVGLPARGHDCWVSRAADCPYGYRSRNALVVQGQSTLASARAKVGLTAFRTDPDVVAHPPACYGREAAGGVGFGGEQTVTWDVPFPGFPGESVHVFAFTGPVHHVSSVPELDADATFVSGADQVAPEVLPGGVPQTGESATVRTFADGLTMTLDQEITTEDVQASVDTVVERDLATEGDAHGALTAGRGLSPDSAHYWRSRFAVQFLGTAASFYGPIFPAAKTLTYGYRLRHVDLATGVVTYETRTLERHFPANAANSDDAEDLITFEGEAGRMTTLVAVLPTDDAAVPPSEPPLCVTLGPVAG